MQPLGSQVLQKNVKSHSQPGSIFNVDFILKLLRCISGKPVCRGAMRASTEKSSWCGSSGDGVLEISICKTLLHYIF